MSTRIIEPDATVTQGAWTRTGGATVHGVLSDDSDATYMTPSASFTDTLEVGMANPGAAPGGGRILQVWLNIRASTPSSTASQFGYRLRSGAQNTSTADTGFIPVAPTTFTPGPPFTYAPDGGLWNETKLMGLSVQFELSSGNTTARLLDFDLLIDDDEPPVVTVTQPTDDSGAAGTTVTTTSTPSTAWTYADPEFQPQERWEVRRYRQPTAGWGAFDPDTTSEVPVETRTGVGTATSTVMSVTLENGATYRDYVRASDPTPAGFPVRYSFWAFREYTVTLTAPPNPTIVATPDTPDNRVAVVLTAGTTAPTTEYFTLERSDDGGTTWLPVRSSPITNTGGAVTTYDYEAPRSSDGTDQPIRYRARATDTGTGLAISSAAVQSLVVNLLSDGNSWFKSTSDPTLNMVVCVTPEGTGPTTIGSESEEPQSVYYAQGAYYPTVHSADIRAERWPTLSLKFDDDAQREDFEALRALQEPLLYQSCNGDDGLEQHYVRLGGMRLWRREIDTTQNTAQVAFYSVVATEVEMP